MTTARSTTAIVQALDIHKTYQSGQLVVHALHGVDLKVEPGEMVAIMGPSGCGKTTLLNCLSGLDEIDSGSILINGVELATMSDDQKTHYRASRMGYVFQAFNLLPVLTAVENVEMPILLAGTKAREARERAVDSLALVGLMDRANQDTSALSGGQQQRVAIARALVNDPEIVWGDEPTGNLDSTNSFEVMQLLRKLNRDNGQTFILVTHSKEVAQSANRVVHMNDGEIVREERN